MSSALNPLRVDRHISQIFINGSNAADEMFKRSEEERTESIAVLPIEVLVHIGMQRLIRKHDSLCVLKMEAQRQQEEIEAFSRGKPEEYQPLHSELSRRLHRSKLLKAKRNNYYLYHQLCVLLCVRLEYINSY